MTPQFNYNIIMNYHILIYTCYNQFPNKHASKVNLKQMLPILGISKLFILESETEARYIISQLFVRN